MTTIHEQVERLRGAVANFTRTFGRKPVLLIDADGVIYRWNKGLAAHYHQQNPSLPAIDEDFDTWDITTGRTPEQAAALLRAIDEMDYSLLEPYAEAVAVIPLLIELGFDIAIATSHTTANLYSASAKVFTINRDFDGTLDTNLIITQDKTRLVGDWLLDDKPEITGRTDVTPLWEQIIFTHPYNAHIPGVRLVWETALEVLAEVVERRTATPKPVGEEDKRNLWNKIVSGK